MNAELLRRYLAYYQDLGIQTLYLRVPAHASAPMTAEELLFPVVVPPGETLEEIRADLGECKRCRLREGRNKIVFGIGNPQARLVFVGEGPGADEDAQGIPFVGRAGQLLTQMVENTARREGIPLERKDVLLPVARALVNNPSILLADEPTGALDSVTGNEIMGLFERLYHQGNTIVVVTHEADIAMRAHRVIHIRDGKVEKDERIR